jgi:hypothetical protein
LFVDLQFPDVVSGALAVSARSPRIPTRKFGEALELFAEIDKVLQDAGDEHRRKSLLEYQESLLVEAAGENI